MDNALYTQMFMELLSIDVPEPDADRMARAIMGSGGIAVYAAELFEPEWCDEKALWLYSMTFTTDRPVLSRYALFWQRMYDSSRVRRIVWSASIGVVLAPIVNKEPSEAQRRITHEWRDAIERGFVETQKRFLLQALGETP